MQPFNFGLTKEDMLHAPSLKKSKIQFKRPMDSHRAADSTSPRKQNRQSKQEIKIPKIDLEKLGIEVSSDLQLKFKEPKKKFVLKPAQYSTIAYQKASEQQQDYNYNIGSIAKQQT
jgi:hypothetical protein